jgi:hypothetical protein
MKTQIDAAVKNLSNADTGSLYAKLGAYSVAFPQGPAQFAAPDATVQVDVGIAGALDDAIALGKRILKRWNKAIFDLVCSKDGVDPQARKTIMNALTLNSPEALAAAITSVLIGVFSVGPAVAAVVGVLFGKVLLPAAGEEACKFWKERL